MEKQKVKIISDSTCDFTPELCERYNVGIIPLHVLLGDKVYTDGVDIDPDMIFNWADENKKTPNTSMPTPAEAMKVFEDALSEYEEIVAFTISASMSGSYQVFCEAAKNLGKEDKIFVVDSANLSTGIALMLVEAALMAKAGDSGETIAARMEELKSRVRSSFVVDTLMYLYRGGRCSGVSALVGGALHLHPRIYVEDGEMKVGRKYRGGIDRVIMNYVHDMEDELKAAEPARAFITSAGCPEETKTAVTDYLGSLDHFDEIIVCPAASVVSSHCGPGTLGVMYIEGK